MAEVKQYLDILLESLAKKKEVLQEILDANGQQSEILKENGSLDEFDVIVKKKESLIEKLEILDNGFESVYERIRETLQEKKEDCKTEIWAMQELIQEVTGLSASIESSEQRNKQLVEKYFSYAKGKIRHAKKSVRTATDYYKNMSRMNYIDSMLMDKKQ